MTATLTNLQILTLDCQATGANPDKGHLLEIGWIPTRASAADNPAMTGLQAYLVRLPADAAIPRAVERITGISDDTTAAGISSAKRLGASDRNGTTNHRRQPVGSLSDWLSILPALKNHFYANFTKKITPKALFPSGSSAPMRLRSACCPICRAGASEPLQAISAIACRSSNAVPTMLSQPHSSGKRWSNY